MPTYVYACQTCGAQFEQFQRFSDEPLTVCLRCQGTLRRVFQPVGIVFKGSGWYVTDSRSNSSTTASATSNGDSATASSTSSDSATTEAAPVASETPPKSEPAPATTSEPKAA